MDGKEEMKGKTDAEVVLNHEKYCEFWLFNDLYWAFSAVLFFSPRYGTYSLSSTISKKKNALMMTVHSISLDI